ALFLEQAAPGFAERLDCTRARVVDREVLSADGRGSEAELLFEVPYRTAEGAVSALVLVLIERPGAADALLPLRIVQVATIWWEQQRAEWERIPAPRPPLRLRPVLPVVLYVGVAPRDGKRTLDSLVGANPFRPFASTWEPSQAAEV